MRNDLTEIVLVVDRSGSMATVCIDAENGINHFIEEQKKAPGEANFTLVQFDTHYDFVAKGVPIEDAPEYVLVPRGWTALLDAVGRAISETGERLASLPEDQRPGIVIVMIVTDGHENSSTEYTFSQIKEMISHQREKYNWHFNFLGADESAFDVADSIGIPAVNTSEYLTSNIGKVYSTLSTNTSSARSAGICGQSVSVGFSDTDRETLNASS